MKKLSSINKNMNVSIAGFVVVLFLSHMLIAGQLNPARSMLQKSDSKPVLVEVVKQSNEVISLQYSLPESGQGGDL